LEKKRSTLKSDLFETILFSIEERGLSWVRDGDGDREEE
jgi:hypothetical protein